MQHPYRGRLLYTARIRPERIELCCHCVGEFNSPVELSTNLKQPEGPYSVVLPVCKACLENSCSIIVRAARQNAQAKQARIGAMAAREAGRQERVDIEADASLDSTPVATPATTAPPKQAQE